MSLISAVARSPKRALGVLGTMAVAGAVVVGSGASFTYDTERPDNRAAAGSFIVLNQTANGINANGTAIFDIENIVPGKNYFYTVKLKNDGDYPAKCFAIMNGAGNSDMLVDTEGTNPEDTTQHGKLSTKTIVGWDRFGPEVTAANNQVAIDHQFAHLPRFIQLSRVNNSPQQNEHIQPGQTATYQVSVHFQDLGPGLNNPYESSEFKQQYRFECENA
jgi:Camelysin metallo-endopeptidase